MIADEQDPSAARHVLDPVDLEIKPHGGHHAADGLASAVKPVGRVSLPFSRRLALHRLICHRLAPVLGLLLEFPRRGDDSGNHLILRHQRRINDLCIARHGQRPNRAR